MRESVIHMRGVSVIFLNKISVGIEKKIVLCNLRKAKGGWVQFDR